ncbi:hypothetical protein OROHE_026256 [Orobanche hederae]
MEHEEGIQVLHYGIRQKFVPHHDYSVRGFGLENGGRRMATFLMYLSDVEEGGETVFPAAEKITNDDLSVPGKGISIKPKMGDALLFSNLMPDGTLDPSTLHG